MRVSFVFSYQGGSAFVSLTHLVLCLDRHTAFALFHHIQVSMEPLQLVNPLHPQSRLSHGVNLKIEY
jgi:hypothetical protein